ncbi:MAG: hypothetical protein ACRCUS_05340 [Anaerovoracaceae bacterium]
MKKYALIIVMIVVIGVLLSGCGKNGLSKPGVKLYELSSDQKTILAAVGQYDNSKIFEIKAPEGAKGFNVNLETLQKDKTWSKKEIGGFYFHDNENSSWLDGLLGLSILNDGNIQINLSDTKGAVTSEANGGKIVTNPDSLQGQGFLTGFTLAELNKEIPIYMHVEDAEEAFLTGDVSAYFDPKQFEGMDVVKMVTLTFTGKEK